MRLPEEYDDEPKMNVSAVYSIIGVALFIAVILILVLVINHENAGSNSGNPVTPGQDASSNVQAGSESTNPGKIKSPDDLDFWDMYPVETKESEPKEEETKEEVLDPSTDGKHTKVINAAGEEEWVLINQYLTKNNYDFTKLVCQSDIMKYYEEGKLVSYAGVDISEEQDYVDFVKVKKSGIDFVMIRMGARTYSTGQIMEDDYFADNIKRATDAGLDVGVYFFSQAVTEAEAEEEAKTVIKKIKDYKITYPVVFKMSYISNDKSRIDALSKEEKTKIAEKFLETIKNAGYVPMVYGTKEWLIKQVDLTRLNEYDFWLSQPGDLPDYPYKFTMWQYGTSSAIDGIAGQTNLNISFIDYSEK